MFINGHGTYIRDLNCFTFEMVIPPYQAWRFMHRSPFCQLMVAHYPAYPGDEKMVSDGLGNKCWVITEIKGPIVLGLFMRDGEYILVRAIKIAFLEAAAKMRYRMQSLDDLLKRPEFA